MKILKHGNQMKTMICLNCGCEFMFHEREEKFTWINSPFDGQIFQSYHWINCPECKKEIQIRS